MSYDQTHLYVCKGLDGRFQKKKKLIVDLKKIVFVRDEVPYFSEALGFSLPSLLVNPALPSVV